MNRRYGVLVCTVAVFVGLAGFATSVLCKDQRRPRATTEIESGGVAMPDLTVVSVCVSTDTKDVSCVPTSQPVEVDNDVLIFVTTVVSNRIYTACDSTVELYMCPKMGSRPDVNEDCRRVEHEISLLNAGETCMFTRHWRIPKQEEIEPGDYYIVAVCGGDLVEGPKHNNSAWCEIRITGNTPSTTGEGNSDLFAVSGWTSPTSAVPGQYITVACVTSNAAATSATSSTSKLYISDHNGSIQRDTSTDSPHLTLGANSVYWFSVSVSALNGGKCYTNTSSRAVPSSLSAGLYDVYVVCATAGGSECTTPTSCRMNNTNKLMTIQVTSP